MEKIPITNPDGTPISVAQAQAIAEAIMAADLPAGVKFSIADSMRYDAQRMMYGVAFKIVRECGAVAALDAAKAARESGRLSDSVAVLLVQALRAIIAGADVATLLEFESPDAYLARHRADLENNTRRENAAG